MEIVENISIMKNLRRNLTDSVGFVPTMGYLHDGHLSLVKQARTDNDIAIVSIFINPTQFGPKEDFKDYPRDMDRDSRLLEELGVDYMFYHDHTEMYTPQYKTYVEVEDLPDKWEGESRPGHFRGVCTVVLKLVNIVLPDVAFFGQKDAQQAVHDCEREAKQSITDAQIAAQHIITRTDQRISDMEMRHSHKLNKHIRDIEKQGAEKADAEAGGHLEAEKLASVIIELAIELCPCDADDGPDS